MIWFIWCILMHGTPSGTGYCQIWGWHWDAWCTIYLTPYITHNMSHTLPHTSLHGLNAEKCNHSSCILGMPLGCIVHDLSHPLPKVSLGCRWDARCIIHHTWSVLKTLGCHWDAPRIMNLTPYFMHLWDATGMPGASYTLRHTSQLSGMPLGCHREECASHHTLL